MVGCAGRRWAGSRWALRKSSAFGKSGGVRAGRSSSETVVSMITRVGRNSRIPSPQAAVEVTGSWCVTRRVAVVMSG